MARFKLTPAEIKKFNNDLKDLQDIQEDIKRAENAGVPNMPALQEACDYCRQRIEQLKASYSEKSK